MEKKWNSYTGEEILYNAMDNNGSISNEPMFEDAIKQGLNISSDGDCLLLKFYWTDGFGWYFNGTDIVFILHECKIGNAVGKTFRGYLTCVKKAFLQIIGYYFKIKNGEYSRFSKKLSDLAIIFGYTDISKFIIDHFGMFLITSDKFVCNITINDSIKELLSKLEEPIKNTEKTPSKYWEEESLKKIMQDFDILDIPFTMMPDNVDLADTGKILNNILNNGN